MYSETRYSDYDLIARQYNENWVPSKGQKFLPSLDKLILQYLPTEGHILDLCCGTGQTSQYLLGKGYQVTCLDGSEEMLSYARKNAPAGQCVLDDARFFKLSPSFHGVISMGALAHILTLGELENVFRNVYDSLLENGLFVFDLYLKEVSQASLNGNTILHFFKQALSRVIPGVFNTKAGPLAWDGSFRQGAIENDFVYASRWTYDLEKRLGAIKIIAFQLLENGYWQRSDLTLPLKPYSPEEVQPVLERVGFTQVSFHNAELDMGERNASGRAYFVARKL